MVGSGIRKLRSQRNLTQDDLAQKLGVSRQAVCMWEANKRELRATMLHKIAKFFDVAVDDIIKSENISVDGREDFQMKRKLSRIKTPKGGLFKKDKMKKVNFELLAQQANRVVVTGDFNSWDTESVIMKKNRSGLWKTNIHLKPGRYEYKFIVDGQWWNDPRNANTVVNPSGSLNSVKEVL